MNHEFSFIKHHLHITASHISVTKLYRNTPLLLTLNTVVLYTACFPV
uniref:Uncharacterized protein n=1 Tax=Anguilla anguilla TaxID=7936 RepID=A0A0E9S0S5_ANGAN